ncbi:MULTISPECIES: hypothetical protein [Bacillus cereus group]|uniref:hypothetical protein n=1 Tax=Bacillus cereus group TaxID=86661 RepID=UPI0038FCD864
MFEVDRKQNRYIVTTKLTNLCYLKAYELKALDCQLKATSAFLRFSVEIMWYNRLRKIIY